MIVHLLPLTIALAEAGATLTIETEYPFGDVATITLQQAAVATGRARPRHSRPVRLALRVPGWADAATIAVDGRPHEPLRNGTLFWWNCTVGAAGLSAVVQLNPRPVLELGWGSYALPGPSAVNFSAAGRAAHVPTNNSDADWVLVGASVAGSRGGGGGSDLRSGSPGAISTAMASHPLNSLGHLLTAVSFRFQYVAGYDPGPGKHADAPTLRLVLVDALNATEVASLYSSPPLGNYSYDRFTGYSPPITVRASGLAVAWPRSLRLAIVFDNHQRNLQVPLASLLLSVEWSPRLQPFPFSPSDLSTPNTNAAAVRRGPLLFALPLQPTTSTLSRPASGGECERPLATGRCRSSDLEFNLGDGFRWNYALLLPTTEPASALSVQRTSDRAPTTPFDPAAPPLTISVAAKLVPEWKALGSVTDPPPPSPLPCNGTGAAACSGVATTLQLVPFGSTQIRIAAFPWIAI